MNKLLLTLVISASAMACGGPKKETTTPTSTSSSNGPAMEHRNGDRNDAFGGAGYGGKSRDATANPCNAK